MYRLRDEAIKGLSLAERFAFTPQLYMKTDLEFCPSCHAKLLVKYTDTRKIHLLDAGECKVHRSFMYCPDCRCVYPAGDYAKHIPACSNTGYDVMVLAGRLIFCHHHTISETVSCLKNRNVHLSPSQVWCLAQRFIVYLSLLHQQCRPMISMHMLQKGGYILHIDGTCQGASPHLITAMDEVSNFVLANAKIPSESKEEIIPFLMHIKGQYGKPLAVSSDMGNGMLAAIARVFPGVPNFICHFHFLRDIGKDLLEKDYAIIRNRIKKYGVSKKLRYRLKYDFENKQQKIHAERIHEYIQRASKLDTQDSETILQLCHVLQLWALNGKKHGNGYGFPFDRPHAEFYRRLRLLWEQLGCLVEKCTKNKALWNIINRIVQDIAPLMDDNQALKAYMQLTKKQVVFDNLREALAIAPPGGTNGLNDQGQNIPMETIKSRVSQFRNDLIKTKAFHKQKEYHKVVAQLDKYHKMLFCDPIKIKTPEGECLIQPQRTNNILEQFFRSMRRSHRRTTGNNSMCKKLQSMIADTPLVKNLNNQQYLSIILDGKKSLEEAFAEINHQQVIKKLKEHNTDEAKIPRKILSLIRHGESVKKVLCLIAS